MTLDEFQKFMAILSEYPADDRIQVQIGVTVGGVPAFGDPAVVPVLSTTERDRLKGLAQGEDESKPWHDPLTGDLFDEDDTGQLTLIGQTEEGVIDVHNRATEREGSSQGGD